jgi:cell division protein FtsL
MNITKSVRKYKETLEYRSLIFQRIRTHRYFPIIVLVGVLLVVGCIHIWQRVYVIKLVKEVSLLKAENISLTDDYKKVQSDIAALSMASRIETYSADSLGLQAITANRLFTLVKKTQQAESPDELTALMSSFKRVAKYVPVLSGSNATAGELETIKFDSVECKAGEK